MTVEQIDRILTESLSLFSPYANIWVLGGEPSLHPDLDRVMVLLNNYRKNVGNCIIRFWTHGWGKRVTSILEVLPSWVKITNSKKKPGIDPLGFNPFLLAPLDYRDVCPDEYRVGCKWILPGKCGIGITRHGVYVCAVAGAIDRIVGFDIGISSIREISHYKFQEQCEVLCGYCGHFLVDNGIYLDNELISETWRKLIADYTIRPPSLTPY